MQVLEDDNFGDDRVGRLTRRREPRVEKLPQFVDVVHLKSLDTVKVV